MQGGWQDHILASHQASFPPIYHYKEKQDGALAGFLLKLSKEDVKMIALCGMECDETFAYMERMKKEGMVFVNKGGDFVWERKTE